MFVSPTPILNTESLSQSTISSLGSESFGRNRSDVNIQQRTTLELSNTDTVMADNKELDPPGVPSQGGYHSGISPPYYHSPCSMCAHPSTKHCILGRKWALVYSNPDLATFTKISSARAPFWICKVGIEVSSHQNLRPLGPPPNFCNKFLYG